MKQLLTTLAIVIATSMVGQSYSTFYGTYDVNQNVNVNKNVKVSGTVNQNVNKTVTTIDYGALAAANAQQEANRLNAMQYTDSRDAMIAKEIAADPFAAFTYGTPSGGQLLRMQTNKVPILVEAGHRGKKVVWEWTTPNKMLFSAPFTNIFRNTTADGAVLCEIEVFAPYVYSHMQSKFGKEIYPDYTYMAKGKAETDQKKGGDIIEIEGEDHFTHKTEIGRATVYGIKGYRATWIYETDYEYVIKDNYYSDQNGIFFAAGIRYTVEKSRGTFEDLEGRRYYLRRLAEEIIATANFRYW